MTEVLKAEIETQMRKKQEICLSIAASDSSAGAGIQADLKTFAAHDVYGLTVLTAVTAQNSYEISSLEAVSLDLFKKQLQAVFIDYQISAIKIGVLTSSTQVDLCAEFLKQYAQNIPIICDPVLKSTSGTVFADKNILHVFREKLLPLVTLVTPNYTEAIALLDLDINSELRVNDPTLEERKKVLLELKNKFKSCSVLLTGGLDFTDEQRLSGKECIDLMLTKSSPKIHVFKHPFIESVNTHGTGCTLSSAIAANMSRNLSLHMSVQKAIDYTSGAINYGQKLGAGKGVLGHFHTLNRDRYRGGKSDKKEEKMCEKMCEKMHEKYMRMALDLAKEAAQEGEVPVGAILVSNGEILAQAVNSRERDSDPCGHAEVNVLRIAGEKTSSWRLADCDLFVTLEPCFMCAGAIVNARISRLIYGASDQKAGAVHSLAQVCTDPRLNHQVKVTRGVLADESSELLKNFFKKRRK